MNTISIPLPLDQFERVILNLSHSQKIALWRLLDSEIDRVAIAKKFAKSVSQIRQAYQHISEDEVMQDVIQATRASRRA